MQALDGATGDLIWEYKPQVDGPRPLSMVRGLSIYGDTIFVPLPNARLVALDAHTGRVAWEVGDADARAASSRTTCQSAIGSLTPELTPGRAGNVLMVFALPQSASGRPSR